MAGQPFEQLAAGSPSLLTLTEQCVVTAHQALWQARGLSWTPHSAYHWLHYEDPMPVDRLLEGARRLADAGGVFDGTLVANALARAAEAGYLET